MGKLRQALSFAALLTLASVSQQARAEESASPKPSGTPSAAPPPAEGGPTPDDSMPATYVPGKGYDVYKGDLGSLNISAYVLLRYLNQLPANQAFTDHLGNIRSIDSRNDIQLHRVMIHFSGFLFNKNFTQDTMVWAVNSTNSVTALSALTYKFGKGFSLTGGIGALPGTRSMNYEHPYFLGTDRQFADEFFRPSFTGGVWASGEPIDKFQYRMMVGDNLNIVDISAGKLTRDLALGGTLAWFPTTGEFGPRGGFGDFEMHEQVATRFGVSKAHSREDRFSQVNNPNPDNTTIKLSDSVPLFETGALAPGVTLQQANFDLNALDAAIKYRGFFLFVEGYFRHLSDFDAGGAALPQDTIDDTGFMIQSSYMVVPRRWEMFLEHSQIYGEFNRAWEATLGSNWYPFKSRALRLNASLIYVDRSSMSSLFGYYVGGQKGPTVALATDFVF